GNVRLTRDRLRRKGHSDQDVHQAEADGAVPDRPHRNHELYLDPPLPPWLEWYEIHTMRTIRSLWEEAVAERRTTPAYLVEEPDGSWREVSWSEAAEAVDELAHGLLALGLKKGDSFGILARTRVEWVLLDLALAHIGAVPAPIYPSSTASEAHYILEHSAALGCFVDEPEQLEKIESVGLEHVYTVETLPDLRALGREHAAGDPEAVRRAREQIGEDDLFTFIYTSGTTGPPKACMIRNRN